VAAPVAAAAAFSPLLIALGVLAFAAAAFAIKKQGSNNNGTFIFPISPG
jgi:hypothetical protein